MNIHETLGRASQFAASRRRLAMSTSRKDARLWLHVGEFKSFIEATGQAYLFEDDLETRAPTLHPHASASFKAHADATSRQAMDLLLSSLEKTPEVEPKQSITVLVHLANFIFDTGQGSSFEDHVHHRLEYAPLAIAHFATFQEAERWLMLSAEPPSPVYILVGDDYYMSVYSREDNVRSLYRDFVIEPYIQELTAKGLPSTVPSFETRSQAEAWLEGHPAAPFGFISIAGELHFAAHHGKLRRHTLHPVAATLTAWEENRRTARSDAVREVDTGIEGAD